MLKPWVSVMLLVSSLAGCTSSGGASGGGPVSDTGVGASQSASSEVDLRFAYSRIADAGTIDQTISIANPSIDLAAIPTLSFQALDANSNPLAAVSVKSVFGSDRGLVVAPANYEVFDILRFEGSGSERVADVKVTVKTMRTVEDSGTTYPEVDYLDAQGRPVQHAQEARAVRVRNAGASGYVVRLVGIRWDQPFAGRSQQARDVAAVGGPVQLAAGSDIEVPIAPGADTHFDSLKAYISIEQL